MRGGLERWKRGVDSGGVRSAIAYALNGGCDAASRLSTGAAALAAYGDSGSVTVTRFTVTNEVTEVDELDREQLAAWVDGFDPLTRERRGRDLSAPNADLVLDGTINAPKSYSLVSLLHPELAGEFEALQDRLRDRIITTWQRELNARRGAGGRIRERLHQVEVVELQHRRSRALDPHIHRHLWLSVKVLGADGVWSNVDSRVAMKLHTLINAEGDLAARTDPEWIDALARHGYTLNADGEVAEVAHAVRALSRRSNQIEANRAVLLAAWRAAHPGQEPSRDVLQQLDRRAWAQGRPGKPKDLREDRWELMIRDELATIDPALLAVRPPVTLEAMPAGDLDIEMLAARAVVDADARSSAYGGRFSMFDVRAGATRAVAAAGVVAPRDQLQVVVDAAVNRALGHTVDLLDEDPQRPQHVKGYMAVMTAALKVELARRFELLSAPGAPLSVDAMMLVAEGELPPGAVLDPGQGRAAGAISGTDRLVTVTGPAGTGKTTMLRVAHAALALQQRRMIVVAPTKKAATVAGQEIGAVASSVHALLADHGWRWGRDAAGAAEWSRLAPGDTDPNTGLPYTGPARYAVYEDDRIVIDEAGMLDLHTANALAALAIETGAGLAMVGDHLQAMPVGHSGAMATMARRSGTVVELTAVHRFHDPTYAALTLRLREPESREAALEVAAELDRRGLVRRVDDFAGATDLMVEGYFRWAGERKRVALVTSTNEEADAVNESIQQRRLELGELNMQRVAVGRGEQRLLEGDVVQTRRNDRKADVENRALWMVRRIRPDSVDLVSLTDSADFRRVSTDYVAEHVHLAYASTVHGIQGETTDAAIVGPGVDASGLYVGMTRGRTHNEAIAISRTQDAAIAALADSMTRGVPEVTIDDSRRAATIELQRAARPQPDTHTGPLASQGAPIQSRTPTR
ncbi:AAA family ATPase [Microbacterium sp. Marseille-Q6648]|uniref:AAA family ATPase n=1 Tax=Microbacterium sp. Marseille-Q6648 TaxID=2937991 RepID=UPI00203BB7AD|nr:AAA family ATPase [Microbacterium sp. Marseille-Q6648]